MYRIREIGDGDKEAVAGIVAERWGSPIIVSRGKVHNVSALPGFVAEMDGKIVGLATYNIDDGECEITSLDSMLENRGVGTGLIDAVVSAARAASCRRVWLISTNDNTKAIRYYQKRGFSLAAVHLGAIKRSRAVKPEIPLYGIDGIPILHELEFEKVLMCPGGPPRSSAVTPETG